MAIVFPVTDNFYLPQEGSWKEIVPAGSTVDFLDIRSFPCNHGFYVLITDTAPTNTDRDPVGIKVDGECYFVNVQMAGVGVWARCLTPAHGGSGNSQELRLDVTAVYTTA